MEIKVLGAAGEVGRSAFQVNCDGTNFLLDYGVMFGKPRGAPPTYPLHVKPRDIDSVITISISPISKSAGGNNLEPLKLMSPV